MKKKIRYFGRVDLKTLRRSRHWTAERLAELTYCSTRTIFRIEQENGTGNEVMAKNIAEAYGYTRDRLFLQEDQVWLELLSEHVPRLPPGVPLPGVKYYLLHVCRNSLSFADIWGKTQWTGYYRERYERRVLHELSGAGVEWFAGQGAPVLNTAEEWDSFFYHAIIGRGRDVVISEACMRARVPCAAWEYAVEPRALYTCYGPDVILLGSYKGRTDVFPIR